MWAGHQINLEGEEIICVKFMVNPFQSLVTLFTFSYVIVSVCVTVFQSFVSYTLITLIVASRLAEFVSLYTKAFMFSRYVLLENSYPSEQHSDFICN
jgi:hypothetical protein